MEKPASDHLQFDENGYLIVDDKLLQQSLSDADIAYDELLLSCARLQEENESEIGTTIYYVLQQVLIGLLAQGWTVAQLCQDVREAAPLPIDAENGPPVTMDTVVESQEAADELFDEFQARASEIARKTEHTDRSVTGFFMWKNLMAQLLTVNGFSASDLHEEIDEYVAEHAGSGDDNPVRVILH